MQAQVSQCPSIYVYGEHTGSSTTPGMRGGKHTPIVRRGHTYIVGVVKSAASFFFFWSGAPWWYCDSRGNNNKYITCIDHFCCYRPSLLHILTCSSCIIILYLYIIDIYMCIFLELVRLTASIYNIHIVWYYIIFVSYIY